MRKLIKKLSLITFTFVWIFLLLELYARFIIKQPYYAFPHGYFINNEFYGYGLAKDFKGNYSQPEFTISIDTNSDGLRDVEHTEVGNSFKILALGDSFTFGVGVELDETYLSLLEKMLSDNKKGKNYKIIKAGVVGYSTYNERIYLEKKGLNYNSDMVIIQFWWDDLGIDQITYLADTGFLTTGKITNFAHLRLFLNRYFRSYAFLRMVVTRKFRLAIFAKNQVDIEDEDNLRDKFAITLKEFKKIESICKHNHMKNLFILVPTKEFVYNKLGQARQWEYFCNFLNNYDIKYIDLMPILKKAVKRGHHPFLKVDPHLNKGGHRLVAQEIYQYLSSLGY